MFEKIITDFFMLCVYILQVIGGAPGEYGFGYYLANIIIFMILLKRSWIWLNRLILEQKKLIVTGGGC